MIGTSPHNYSGMQCPCCQMEGTLARHHERKDINQRVVEIATCLYCTALVDITNLREMLESGRNAEIQRESSAEFYAVTDEIVAQIESRVKNVSSIIDFALAHLPADFPRHAFADFGAGMGHMTAAGAERFDVSHAIEFNTVALHQLHPHFPFSGRIRITEDLEKVEDKIDLVTVWHTIEHMPDAQTMLQAIRAKLSDSGAMMFQCPMFNPNYVVFSHYFFLNEFAARTMCERAGFGDVQVWFDTDADFITCLAMNNRKIEPVSRHAFSAEAMIEERVSLAAEKSRLAEESADAKRDTLVSRRKVKQRLGPLAYPLGAVRRALLR